MVIAIRCEMCGHNFMNKEDDLCLEIDFKEKKMSFICRNKKCKHENILDFANWQKQQKHSPLPQIRTM